MNIAEIGYEQIQPKVASSPTDSRVFLIGDLNDYSCDVCVDVNDPLQSIDDMFEKISEDINSNSEIYINSMIGIKENFLGPPEFIQKYVDFFCLLFNKLLISNKKVNFLQIGTPDSPIIPLFEGIAFSCEYEYSNLHAKTLKITHKLFPSSAQLNQIWLLKYKSFLITHDNVYIKKCIPFKESNNFVQNRLKHAGVYVITGGNGGIGFLISKWLVENYQARVILIGRRELNEEQKKEVKNVGVSAYISTDVSDYEELEKSIGYIRNYYGHIDGIFHLAGIIKDKLLRNYESRDVNLVISPKIYGALNLFKISQKIDLGFVCLFSSISGIIGNIGQAVYSAANAFMDNFCSYLRNEKDYKNWFSINWGAWASDGMRMPVKSLDVELMSPKECFKALEYILSLGNGRIAIWNGNPSLLEQHWAHENKIEAGNENNFLFKEAIQTWVYECIRKFSGFSKIDFDQSIIDLGVDSVGLINITVFFENEIRKHVSGYKLSKALLFERFSINKITSFFLETLSSKVLEYITGLSLKENTKKQKYDSSENTLSPCNGIDKHISKKFSNAYNDEDIAIVGIAGEFPEAVDVSELETILSKGICAIKIIPNDRWNWKKYYSQDKSNKNSTYCRHGGFIKNAAGFDNAFFKITPSEAIKIDPQERKFLQVSYNALEDGGYFATLDKRVGVFVAAMFNHYQNFDNTDLPIISNSPASIANRLSFFMNFNGPSVCIDSMCSGSLTALNLAIDSIVLGECSSAVVGGVNIMPRSEKYVALSQSGFLSPTGKCQSFGVGADGYVPGEGIVSIFIKKLGNAITDGNKIYGIIKGIAVNSVGTSSGYTVPSISAQADVIRNALNKAAIKPEDVTYIETHGTGTALGDPIEIEGIKSAYGSSVFVLKQSTCWLGAIKSNIGHLESAAGLAGLAKIVLQFQNKKIYPNLFSNIENPELSLDKTRFKLAKSVIEWNGQYAGLSAFGAGGSNAHVIMQRYEQNSHNENMLDSYIIPLSAKTDEALGKRISDLLLFVENADYDLYSLSYTLCCARQHFEKRVCYLVKNKNELLDSLRNRKVEQKLPNDLMSRYINNEPVDFSVLFPIKSIQTLPLYPFMENTYWLNFDRIEGKEKNKFEYSLLTSHYLDAGDISKCANSDEFSTLYINAPYTDSDGYFVVDRKLTSPSKKNNIFVIDYKNAKDWDKIFKKFKQKTLRVTIFDPIDNLSYSYEDLLHIYYTIARVMIAQRIHFKILIVAFKNPKTETEKMQHSIYGLFRTLSLEKQNIEVVMLERNIIRPENLNIIKSFDQYLWKDQNSVRLCISDDKFQKYSFQEISLSSTAQRLKNKGVYLITGGMGSIGLFVAKFLRRKYDARLVLLGRSRISEDLIKESFGDLYDGKCIHYIPTDIEHLEQVRNAVNVSLQYFETIDGIIHSAGQIHDALFDEKKEDEFLATISVKAKGAEHLDICTADIALDFFACFSSLAAITGNIGQSDYITANSYLDIFARSRNRLVRDKKRKGHTISISWPLWINHAKKHSTLKNYLKESLGIDILSEANGVELFDLIVNNVSENIDQIVPLPGRVQLGSFLKYAGYYSSKPESNGSDSFDQKLPVHGIDLNDIVSAVNQVTSNQFDINLDISFGEIGLNSIMLQELAQRLGDRYSVPLPVLVLFKYDSVNKLFRYLNEKLHERAEKHINSAISSKAVLEDRRIAIIGASGKMPNADNLDEYWKNLIEHKNNIVPIRRWKDRKYFGGLINDYDSFDYSFFNISLREATLLDPQQRIFLESCYNTIVDAGYCPSDLTKVGVFVGAQFNDYRNLLSRSGICHHPFVAIGNSNNMIANRVSYFFNFGGPSQTVDTACSSAVVAIHMAVNSLLSGECNYCLAGAVTLMLDPNTTDGAKSMGILSPNFHCATFDESADGYVRSEGVGCVLLKRYSEAIKDGDSIYGVIESISEGHGGHSNSITAPNQDSQTELIVSAYHGDLAKRVSYIETHGTGTKLGDPIEIEALKAAWKKLEANDLDSPVYLGAVKSAVGHLEPAAGMASLFKILLGMKHKQIPANQNFNKLNQLIDFSDTNFKLPIKNISWSSEKPLVAAMSCFGFGGSNTHMVLSEYRSLKIKYAELKEPILFTLSAKNKNSLHAMIANLIIYLSSGDSEKYSLIDVSFTLNSGRDHFQYRVAVIAEDKEELLNKLKALNKSDFKKINITDSDFIIPEKSDALPLKQLYLSGANIDWKAFYKDKECRRLHLPGYVFEKKRCWFKEQDEDE